MTGASKALLRMAVHMWAAGAGACGGIRGQQPPITPESGEVKGDTVRSRIRSSSEIERFGGATNATGARLGDLQHIIYEYALDQGALPATIEAAITAESHRSRELGADFTSLYLDLWGRGVRYTPRGAMFEVRSAGEDAEFGTMDDIAVVGQQGRETPCVARAGTREVRFPIGNAPCLNDFD